MTKPQILVVEDDRLLAQTLARDLEREGFGVILAHDGQDGLGRARSSCPDLIVLDLSLPVKDGLDVCQELRAWKATRGIPIVMATARGGEADQLLGFAAGADDYVVKPYSNKVLIARIERQLSRRRLREEWAFEPVVECQGVVVDLRRHEATYRGRDLRLTMREFRLLEAMIRQPGRAFTRNELIDAALGEDVAVLEGTISVYIKDLRKKLDEAGDLIETVRSVGYRFREPGSEQDADREAMAAVLPR